MELILTIAGTLFAILLAVIAYFLQSIHNEFKEMKENLNSVLQRIAVAEEKGRGGFREFSVRMTEMERRIGKMEDKYYEKN